jgi:hypothetical protein
MTSFEGSDYYDCNKKDKISLEPRLSQYIEKKKFYKHNNIESETLEREYNISDYDRLRIKAHLKGQKDKNLRFQDYVDTSQAYFPSELLQKDPRFDRIKKKQQKIKDAGQQRHNYGGMSQSFDMYREDRPFASAYGDDFTEEKFHPREWFQNSREIEADDYNPYAESKPHVRRTSGGHKKDFSSSNTYTQPHSNYNGYLPFGTELENNNTVDEILNSMNNAKYNYGRTEQRENDFDCHNGTIMPNVRGRRNSSQENNHGTVPFMGDMRGNRDMGVENFVKFGNMTRGSKQIGYPNPVEHYFDYITPDIQDPRHIVMERGVPSRSWNRERGSTIKRDMMS